jgi:methylthioribulose-1-phosphate dehydratase
MLHSPDPREALAWAIANIHQQGLTQGTGGNFSLVLQRDPLRLLMSPSGVDKGLVAPAELIEVDSEGQVVAGKGAASAETLLHLELVETAQANSVLHSHSVFATLLSMRALHQGHLTFSGYEMLKGIEGIKTHEATVVLPIVENSQDMRSLQQQTRHLLSQHPTLYGFLVAGHGLYAWGDSLFQARRHLEIFEFLLELTYRDLHLPQHLPQL